jgi:hypothetical protein
MRRLAPVVVTLLAAAAASAGSPYQLDRSGVLWSASSGPDGLVLTGERDGAQLVRSVIPFPNGVAGTNDIAMQVATDSLTGKIAVVWQRNWSETTSEIDLAVWKTNNWEQITTLSQQPGNNPRNPTVRLTQVKSSAPDPNYPDDPKHTITVQDSFLHVVWWEGSGDTQHGDYALVRLTADPGDSDAITVRNLDDLLLYHTGCASPAPDSVLDHPLFADDSEADRAVLFHGSRQVCLFQLLQVTFTLDDPTQSGGGITVTTQRRRHTPVFGVIRLFGIPRQMDLDGARMLLGDDLNPVAYRVNGPTIQYLTTSGSWWSPVHMVPVKGQLTLDQAIPLIENLAR